jgi:hypothetical protein
MQLSINLRTQFTNQSFPYEKTPYPFVDRI